MKTVKSDIGNLYPYLDALAGTSEFRLSLLSRDWPDLEQWRSGAQSRLKELLHYEPPHSELNPRSLGVKERNGYTEETVRFNTAKGLETTGSLLLPTEGKGPFPCIIALHDHGGFYYYGREKVLEQDDEPEVLKTFKQRFYSGRSWASCLARRGYAVLVIDSYYFGSRKLNLDTVSDDIRRRFPDCPEPDLPQGEFITRYNRTLSQLERNVVRHIFGAGATWSGLMFHDDRRSIDYVLTRPEIDPERIGCCGLSVGAYRSLHLLALDPRIRCAVAAGFMVAWRPQLFNRFRDHTFMLYVPGLYRDLDLPDVAGLGVPKPLLVQQCAQDELFTPESMREGDRKLRSIYEKTGAEGRLSISWYDSPHCFDEAMQEEAFTWLDRWLLENQAGSGSA